MGHASMYANENVGYCVSNNVKNILLNVRITCLNVKYTVHLRKFKTCQIKYYCPTSTKK